MEQTNSQELDKKIFSDLIHDPSAISADDSEVLAGLLEKYPYSQLLRSFHTRSIVHSPSTDFDKELAKTALFSNDRVVLQAIIEDPESLRSKPQGAHFAANEIAETLNKEPAEEEILLASSNNEANLISDQELPLPEVLNQAELEEDQAIEKAPVNAIIEENGIEDHAEDEVGGNDVPTQVITSTEQEELDLHINQNLASTYFFKEDESKETVLDKTEDVFTPEVDIAENITHNAVLTDQQKVSKYDDDKMPYSFLWWLSKTRNEHSDNYQPYVSFQLDTSQSIKRNTVDQLSTQIIENIFHLQSPVDELKNAPKTVPFQVKRKEDFIVEKFIREEPQIKPPNSEKLDNENKARKSAEDPNDLVSETLAHIYTDQMLFHKAIETYKKLSLKFPEKSTYFADQIRELEKKIN